MVEIASLLSRQINGSISVACGVEELFPLGTIVVYDVRVIASDEMFCRYMNVGILKWMKPDQPIKSHIISSNIRRNYHYITFLYSITLSLSLISHSVTWINKETLIGWAYLPYIHVPPLYVIHTCMTDLFRRKPKSQVGLRELLHNSAKWVAKSKDVSEMSRWYQEGQAYRLIG